MPDTIPGEHKLSSPGCSQHLIHTHPLWTEVLGFECSGKQLEMLDVVVVPLQSLQSYQAPGSSTVSSQLMVKGKENKLLCLARENVLPAPGSSSHAHDVNFNLVSELWS